MSKSYRVAFSRLALPSRRAPRAGTRYTFTNKKALASGLTCQPLLETARDTLAWRQSSAAPEALRAQPRYVMTEEQERAILVAWKARG